MSQWRIYQGVPEPHDAIDRLPAPPPWRAFDDTAEPTPFDRSPDAGSGRRLPHVGAYRAGDETVDAVNTALYLRRPLLVTGDPGVGKSTLAYAVAHELKLGPVLRWPINSKSVLRDGLYRYDSLGRLEEAGIARERGEPAPPADLGRFIRLGPLGTALAPYELPRVLLVDEIDKSDIDLPNDLLDAFEEGAFEIPELSRVADQYPTVRVRPADGGAPVTVRDGTVRCRTFPVTVLTSNGEREFPPAFLRRCVRLHLPAVSDDRQLRDIVEAHLEHAAAGADELITRFLQHAETGELATDQLLNAVYLAGRATGQGAPSTDQLVRLVFQHLNETVPAQP